MNKPETLRDLLGGGHISITEVDKIISNSTLFDGVTTSAGPEGYVITAVAYNDLPEHVRGFIRKAVLAFTVENVLDASEDEDEEEDLSDAVEEESTEED